MLEIPGTPTTRPYLIRALYEWCTDNGFTPYLVVAADDSVQVPREYVKDGEIVLNVSFDATSSLKLGNEFIEFKARFAGTAREIMVPIGQVLAIYARENGQGMVFPVQPRDMSENEDGVQSSGSNVVQLTRKDAVDGDEGMNEDPPPSSPSPRVRPILKRVK